MFKVTIINQQIILVVLICIKINQVWGELGEYHHPHHPLEEVKKPPIPILKYTFEQGKEGYQYGYETGNGIHAQESGYIKNQGDKKNEILVQQGTITYHDEHGHPITLTYIADEHGFQPQGAHLPTPPPIPEEIKKSLLENAQHQQYHQQQQIHPIQEYADAESQDY